jgi:hypothetical protein
MHLDGTGECQYISSGEIGGMEIMKLIPGGPPVLECISCTSGLFLSFLLLKATGGIGEAHGSPEKSENDNS